MLNDTLNYERSYNTIKLLSLDNLVSNFSFIAQSYDDRDSGYKIFVKLTQFISEDFRFFLVLVACIIYIPLYYVMNKFIKSTSGIFFSALICESLFVSFFMTGVRQTIAMGIIYASIPLLLKNKTIIHYALLLLAYTIHSSALIFAPVGLLLRYKGQRKLLLLSILMIPFLMNYAPQIVAYVGEGTIFESYAINSNDNLGTPIFSAMVILITVFVAVYSKKFIHSYPQYYKFLFITIYMSCLLMPSSWVDSNFIRIVFTYLIFIMAIIPMILDMLPKSSSNLINRQSVYVLTGGVLLFLMY